MWFFLLVGVVFIVISMLNVRNSHDWGGDFSMYISQSQNILEGKPIGETGYIFNPQYPMLSPKEYPPLFSIVITPIIAVWDIEIQPILIFVSLLFALSSILMFVFFNKTEGVNKWWAIILSIGFLLNPAIQLLKNEILSDILLMVIILCFLIFYKKKNIWLLGVLTALAILTKEIGYCLVIVFILDSIISYIKKEDSAKTISIEAVKFIGVTFLVVILVKLMVGSRFGSAYEAHFEQKDLWESIWINLGYYQRKIHFFLAIELGVWKLYKPLPILLGAIGLTMFIFGWINSKKRINSLFLLVYFGVILVYPYRHGGFRFLFPIIPFILLWIFTSIKKFSWNNTKSGTRIAGFYFFLLIGSYIPHDVKTYHKRYMIKKGPNQIKNQAWMKYIKENTIKNSKVLFFKPRVLYLYTGCKSIANKGDDSIEQIERLMDEFDVNYIVYSKEFAVKNVMVIVKKHSYWQLVYNHDQVKIFKKTDQI